MSETSDPAYERSAWHSPGLTVLVGLAAATITVAGLRSASGLVGPIFLALVLTIAIHPLRRSLTRMRMPGWAAALACVVAVYLILLGLSLALALATARFATLLPTYEPQMQDLVSDVTRWLDGLGIGSDQISTIRGAFDLGRLAGVVADLLGAVAGIVSSLVFICSVVLFMTFDATQFPGQLSRVSGGRQPLVDALAEFAKGTRSYLVVSTVFGLIVAVIDTVVLAMLGIPVPILWGLLAFITNFIPNIGFVIGVVPPAILGLLEGGPGLAVAVVVIYSAINIVIQSVIQPMFVGDAVGLSTTLAFLSVIFWAWVLGPLGALLAIPASLLARAVLVDLDPRSGWLQTLLANRAPPEDTAAAEPPASSS